MMDGNFGMSAETTYKSRRRRSRIAVYQSVVASLACLFLAQSTSAQQIGVDVCACQPSVYEFTFDFELTCDDQSVGGAGITDTTCLTELRGEQNQDDADLLPVAIGQVSIFELDQNLDVIAQTVNTGLFLTGSTFTYTSIIATEPESLNPDSLPRGIQLVFIGVNALNQAIVNTFAILYNNDCGVFPLLRVGQQAGWIIFTDLGNPPEEVCPIAAEPSSSPSSSLTQPPVLPDAPTFSPANVTPAPIASVAPIPPTVSVAPTSTPAPQHSTTAAPSIRCPSGKRRGKGKNEAVKGKGKGYYQKKRKETSDKDKNKGHSELTIQSGKRRGSSPESSDYTDGKGKGSSTKSSGDTYGEGKGASTKSNGGTYGKGKGSSTKSSENYGQGKGSSTSGKRAGVQQKQKDGSYGAMSRIGKRNHLEERLLGIGRVNYQNKNTGASSASQRPKPFEPISSDFDENDSGDVLDDLDDDNTSGSYDDDDDDDDGGGDDDDDDDDRPECIEPDYPISSGKRRGKGSPTVMSKFNGKGKGAPTKSSSGKGSSPKSSSGKGASSKPSSGKGSATKPSSGNSKGISTKSSKRGGKGRSDDTGNGGKGKGRTKGGKGKGRTNGGKGKGRAKGTASSSTKREARNKRHRSSYGNDKTMTKLQKGGKDRFRDLMEREYLNYWGS